MFFNVILYKKRLFYRHLSVTSLLLRSHSSRLFALSAAFLIRFSFLVSSRNAKYFSRKSVKFMITLSSVAYVKYIDLKILIYNLIIPMKCKITENESKIRCQFRKEEIISIVEKFLLYSTCLYLTFFTDTMQKLNKNKIVLQFMYTYLRFFNFLVS